MTDHDILIRVETTVNNLCKKVDDINNKFDKREELCNDCERTIYETIGKVKDNSVRFSLFKWFVGGFCIIIIIMIGYLVGVGTKANSNFNDIKHLTKSIILKVPNK